MNIETNSVLCPECCKALPVGNPKCPCGYLTIESSQSVILGIYDPVPADPLGEEVRFAPEDDFSEVGDISFETIYPGETVSSKEFFDETIAVSTETAPSLATLVDVRPETQPIASEDSASGRRPLRFIRAAALAAIAAAAGGFVVYIAGPSNERPVAVEQRAIEKQGETDLLKTDIFVSRTPAAAADQSVSPIAEIPVKDIRKTQSESQVSLASQAHTPVADASNQPPKNTDAANVEQVIANAPANSAANEAKEAKVAGMVIERPAGRKPLARCADGTFSYSASREAACSQRGGVSEWIADGKPIQKAERGNVAYILGPRGGCYYLNTANQKIYVEKQYCN